MPLPLTNVAGEMADAKAAQLNAWRDIDTSRRHGVGMELEAAFFKDAGYATTPYGDKRRAALESIQGSALSNTSTGDREYEFWKNASGAGVSRVRVTNTGAFRVTDSGASRSVS